MFWLILLFTMLIPGVSRAACIDDISGFWVQDLEHLYASVAKGNPETLEKVKAAFPQPMHSLQLNRLGAGRYEAVHRELGWKSQPGIYDYHKGEKMQWLLSVSGEQCLLVMKGWVSGAGAESVSTRIKQTGRGFCIRQSTEEENWACYVPG